MSLIFLVIQIHYCFHLSQLVHLYFDYKQLRINFSHTFLSILSNICICATPDCYSCTNVLSSLSDEIIEERNLNSSMNIQKLIIKEMEPKIAAFKTTYQQYEIKAISYNDKQLNDLLSEPLQYQIIKINNSKVLYNGINITFKESIQYFINSVEILINYNGNFNQEKIGILLRNENYTISFKHLNKKYISEFKSSSKRNISKYNKFCFFLICIYKNRRINNSFTK